MATTVCTKGDDKPCTTALGDKACCMNMKIASVDTDLTDTQKMV